MGMLLLAVALTASLLQASSNRTPRDRCAVDERGRAPGPSADPRSDWRPALASGRCDGQITNHWSATAVRPGESHRGRHPAGMAVELSGAASDEKAPRVWSIWRSGHTRRSRSRAAASRTCEARATGTSRSPCEPNSAMTSWSRSCASSDASPAGPAGRPTGIDVARHPITAIGRFRRAADTDVHQGVVVSFRTGNLSGGWFELERNGSGWFVAQTGGWIA